MKRIGVIDIISHTSEYGLYSRITSPALSSIMPQVIAVWLKKLGFVVEYSIITNVDDIKELSTDLDIVFISSFTVSAYLAYSLSTYFRNYRTITVLGGPHARSYPEDSLKYFDYVIGLCDKELIIELIASAESNLNKPHGKYLTAISHPTRLASLEDRWEFVKVVNRKRLWFMPNIIPMLGSTGCPYKCEFCIDSKYKYKSMDFDLIEKDLLFLQQMKNPVVMWHDPNFGIQFDKWMELIEKTSINQKTKFLGELNLANLTNKKVKRLVENGFVNVAPGIESWSAFNEKGIIKNYKSKYDKVYKTSIQVNRITKHIPIIQANIMFGLDCDTMEESFELTKEFIKQTPTVYSNLQTITVFGKSTPTYDMYEEQNRLLNLPFNQMDGFSTTNVKINCNIETFYKLYHDITNYYNSVGMIAKKVLMSKGFYPKMLHLSRALFNGRKISSYYKDFSNNLKTKEFLDFYTGKTNIPPILYLEQIKNELGGFYKYLPPQIMEQFFHESM